MGQIGIGQILAIVLVVVGIILIVRSLFGANKDKPSGANVESKDGVPITPRDQRQLPSQDMSFNDDEQTRPEAQVDDDALSNLANVAATRTTKQDEIIEAEPIVVSESFEVTVTETMDETSPVLNEYFHQSAEETLRNNDALLGHKQTVTIVVSPRNSFEGVDGQKIMALVRQYGLKYGILNMFHRYENSDGMGMLWFSMLGVGIDGVEAFDLVTLPESNYRGLAFFVSLPHPQALRGFDSMVQTAKAIADELNAGIHDEAGYILDQSQLQALRTVVGEQA